MILELDKLKQGHVLILKKGDEFSKTCFVCGKEIKDDIFYLCETLKLPFHKECENRTKCKSKSFKEDHRHLKIVDVVKK